MKEFAPSGANSLLYEFTPLEKVGKNKTGRVASPEKVPIHLKVQYIAVTKHNLYQLNAVKAFCSMKNMLAYLDWLVKLFFTNGFKDSIILISLTLIRTLIMLSQNRITLTILSQITMLSQNRIDNAVTKEMTILSQNNFDNAITYDKAVI